MPRSYRRCIRPKRVPADSKWGEYWDRNVQIDVVGLRADDWIDLGECKWHGRPAVSAVARELDARSAHYPGKGRTIRKRVVLRARPKSVPAGNMVHDLPALYEKR